MFGLNRISLGAGPVFALFALALAACQTGNPKTILPESGEASQHGSLAPLIAKPSPPAEFEAAIRAPSIAILRRASGSSGSYLQKSPQLVVVRNQRELKTADRDILGKAELPEVDFTTEMGTLVAVARPNTPGYASKVAVEPQAEQPLVHSAAWDDTGHNVNGATHQ